MFKQFLFLFVFASIGCLDARLREGLREQCRTEIGLSDEEINKAVVPSENLSSAMKCYLRCMFEKGGYIDNNGKLLVDQMRDDHLDDRDEDRVNKVYKCVSDIGSVGPECDDIVDLLACF